VLGDLGGLRLDLDGARGDALHGRLLARLHVHHGFAQHSQTAGELLLLLQRLLQGATRARDVLLAVEAHLADRARQVFQPLQIAFDRLRGLNDFGDVVGLLHSAHPFVRLETVTRRGSRAAPARLRSRPALPDRPSS
jgi:hypothetical protein